MKRKEFHIKAHYFLALAIALTLPFARFTAVFISLLLLNWLREGDFKSKFQNIAKNKLSFIFIAFFLMHAIGLIYTENVDSGLFDLQVKLSLLVFPIIIVSRPYTVLQVRNIFVLFIIGGILCSLFLLSRAVYTYFAFEENNFFYQAFSFLVHPSYLSMYFNLCIVWLMLKIFQKPRDVNRFTLIVSILIILFFSFIIVLLSSKMGLIILFALYLGFTIYLVVSRRKYLLGFAGLLLIVAAVFALFRFVPEATSRLNSIVTAMSSTTNNQADSESTAVRLLIWSASNQVVSENLILGAGTGDAKDVLMAEYAKRGMTGALERKLNAHNEYYQVFVSIGLMGFILLIASLFLPLYKAFTSSNAIYILFLLLVIINFIPESMLETQAGVIFYAFFNSLLCFTTSDNTKLTNN